MQQTSVTPGLVQQQAAVPGPVQQAGASPGPLQQATAAPEPVAPGQQPPEPTTGLTLVQRMRQTLLDFQQPGPSPANAPVPYGRQGGPAMPQLREGLRLSPGVRHARPHALAGLPMPLLREMFLQTVALAGTREDTHGREAFPVSSLREGLCG